MTVLGTPAEEGGGGKIKMIKAGAFQDVSIALMAHPSNVDIIDPTVLSLSLGKVTYRGRAAHAAAAPWEGVNALDAAVSAYTGLSMLRQQMKPSWRVNVIISEGGVKPNIIPERASLELIIRAPTEKELAALKGKVNAVVQSAGQLAGCEVDLEWDRGESVHYSNMLHNSTLVSSFGRHWSRLGGVYDQKTDFSGSTDMGNVSYAVPSIHPTYSVGTKHINHTRDFKDAANTSQAHEVSLTIAKAIACVGLDVLLQKSMLPSAQADFEKDLAAAM